MSARKIVSRLKGLEHSKNANLYFLAPAQTKRMQPILVSCEAPFRNSLQKKHLFSGGHDPHWTSMTPTVPMFFLNCSQMVLRMTLRLVELA